MATNFKTLSLKAASIGLLLIALSSSAEEKQKPEETSKVKPMQLIDCVSIRMKATAGVNLTDIEKGQLITCTLHEDLKRGYSVYFYVPQSPYENRIKPES